MEYLPHVSVIVPFRNEESTLELLLISLTHLVYPKDKVEFILVNDHSTDNSVKIIQLFMEENKNLNIQLIQATQEGKKNALLEGKNIVTSDIILQTDADCQVPKLWIKRMVQPFINPEVKMVAGPVNIAFVDSLFKQMQQIEFASLIASSIGLSRINMHLMCNGANLAYRKSVMEQHMLNTELPSGDDVFLMQNLAAQDINAIVYLSGKAVAVETKPQATVSAFIQQRTRWASKSKNYPSTEAKLLALFIGLINITQLMVFVLLLPYNLIFSLLWLMLKFIAEYSLIKSYYIMHMKLKIKPIPFIIVFLINPIYVLFVALKSQFGSYLWKERVSV